MEIAKRENNERRSIERRQEPAGERWGMPHSLHNTASLTFCENSLTHSLTYTAIHHSAAAVPSVCDKCAIQNPCLWCTSSTLYLFFLCVCARGFSTPSCPPSRTPTMHCYSSAVHQTHYQENCILSPPPSSIGENQCHGTKIEIRILYEGRRRCRRFAARYQHPPSDSLSSIFPKAYLPFPRF